jgi:hypothetical protein
MADIDRVLATLREVFISNLKNDLNERTDMYQKLEAMGKHLPHHVCPRRLAKTFLLLENYRSDIFWFEKFDEYKTTFTTCQCPDHTPPTGGSPRTLACKHILAYTIIFKK